jgi:hypothetical protein
LDRRLIAVKKGVGKLNLLLVGKEKRGMSLNPGEVERVDVGRLIQPAGGELYVVDEVGAPAAKECGGRRDVLGGIPIGSGFKAPCGFGLQIWIADRSGIGIVEVGVGEQTESTTEA